MCSETPAAPAAGVLELCLDGALLAVSLATALVTGLLEMAGNCGVMTTLGHDELSFTNPRGWNSGWARPKTKMALAFIRQSHDLFPIPIGESASQF